ncbi:putative endo-1,3(4)-beta-glucanase, partial [Apodospora peruviana]
MAPSFAKLGAAAALAYVYASGAAAYAPSESYQLVESYDPSNFFTKWTFFVSDFESTDHMAVSPTHGFVNFRNQQDAANLELIKTLGDEVYIGVDSTRSHVVGRDSVRLESITKYNGGLIIAHFNHIPKAVCGAWPAFWMYGPNWPNGGEVDIYEQWNLDNNFNAFHTGAPADVGACTLKASTFTSPVRTSNCFVYAAGQWDNEGCAAVPSAPINPPSTGAAIYATEWTDDVFRIWTWPAASAPPDVLAGEPNPAHWGLPNFSIDSSSCDIGRAFKDMKMVLNIDFCGDAAGNPGIWGADPNEKCYGETGYSWCPTYVDFSPHDFAEVFWKIKDIKVYE